MVIYLREKNVAVAQALEKGKKLEREKAEKEKKAEKIETARNFLKMGLSVEQVAHGTGLSIEEVNEINGKI